MSKNCADRQQEIISALLANRGLTSEESIATFRNPPSPLGLSVADFGIDSNKVIQLIKQLKACIDQDVPILIYGDYDADGIMATAILWEAIRSMGGKAKPFIPNRERHGYGLSIKGLEEALESLNPGGGLIITVDNGIVAHEPVRWLKDQGYQVIITDHHTPMDKMPDADCIVHTTSICGAGVAWVITREIDKQTAESALDLACIGTVADMMPAVGINRSFIAHGLTVLQHTKREGIKALCLEAGWQDLSTMSTYHIGFMIAPRLNAMGRLDDALDSLRLVCTTSTERALALARVLGDTNRIRQDLTLDLVTHARNEVGEVLSQRVIVIDDELYHEGVIGLIAGKLVDTYYRPAIVICRKDGVSKASARSIPGVNITELIRSQSHLLVGVGGHPMAAGFSIETHKIEAFNAAITKHSNEFIEDHLLESTLLVDSEIEMGDITLELYNEIQALQPFGIGNSQPVFAVNHAGCLSIQVMGSHGQHLKLLLQRDHDLPIQALWFNHGDKATELSGKKFINIAFTIDENVWKGKRTLQLLIKACE